MTTETLPVAVPLEPTTPILPSQAIRLGCLIAPRQITGHRFDDEGGACATGALFLGAGLGREATAYLHRDRWPELGRDVRCPDTACFFGRRKLVLSFVIEHLNDSNHNWSRERIADWLAEQGL